jgi:hypothetical protein
MTQQEGYDSYSGELRAEWFGTATQQDYLLVCLQQYQSNNPAMLLTARQLLEQGSPVSDTAASLAMTSNDQIIIDLLLTSAKGESLLSLLKAAISHHGNNLLIVKQLLSRGVQLPSSCYNDLSYKALENNQDHMMVVYLLQHVCPLSFSLQHALLEHHHYSTHNTNNVKRILTITAQVAEAFDINKCRESLPSLLPELHELQMEVVTCTATCNSQLTRRVLDGEEDD